MTKSLALAMSMRGSDVEEGALKAVENSPYSPPHPPPLTTMIKDSMCQF